MADSENTVVEQQVEPPEPKSQRSKPRVGPSLFHVRNEYLCFGFIRDIQAILTQVIPIDIMQLCSQYHFGDEFFLVAHDGYSIQDDGKTLEKLVTEYNTAAFGAAKLPSTARGIFEWTFKILHRQTSMYIGVTTNHDRPNFDLWKAVEGMNACVSTTGTKVVNKDRSSYGPSAMYHEDSVVKMQLDLIDMKLTYFRDGQSLGVLQSNLPSDDDMFYQLCATFLNQKSKITLEEFRQLC